MQILAAVGLATAVAPDRAGPARIAFVARDDMDVELADNIAEGGRLILVQSVTFFRACATMLVSKVSIAWSSGVRS